MSLVQHPGGREKRNCEFGAKLVYIVNSRTTRTTERPCLQKKKEKRKQTNYLVFQSH